MMPLPVTMSALRLLSLIAALLLAGGAAAEDETDLRDFSAAFMLPDGQTLRISGPCTWHKTVSMGERYCQRRGGENCPIVAVGPYDVARLDAASRQQVILTYQREVAERELRFAFAPLSVQFLALAPQGSAWPEFLAGQLRVNPFQSCMGPADAESQEVTCDGFWMDGYGLGNAVYPRVGVVQMDCGAGGLLHGEFLGTARDSGFACLEDENGGVFRAIYGPGVAEGEHAPLDFMEKFRSRVLQVAPETDFCNWDLLI